MPIPMIQVDAFASRPFEGNPAAVCLLDQPASEGWMQLVAREMNLSETAFIVRGAEAHGLRWFTPTTEVDLCGHATLASAHVVWEEGWLDAGARVQFDTRSGRLSAVQADGAIELDFPGSPVEEGPMPEGAATALGLGNQHPRFVGRSCFDLVVELESEAHVRALTPDFQALSRVEARGVMVTSRGSAQHDFVSRFFAPSCGVDEDPVTGSAHCALAPYWQQRLGKDFMHAYQASERGGEIWVGVVGDRVTLRGHAVTVMRGKFEA